MKRSKRLTLLWPVLAALVLLTVAIAVPIFCRSFYLFHFDPLNLP